MVVNISINEKTNKLINNELLNVPDTEFNLITYVDKCIKIIMVNDEQWFCGKDVAKILGYKNETKAIINHVDKDNKLSLIILLTRYNIKTSITNKNDLKTIFIDKNGLIRLLTYSRLPNKEIFIKFCKDNFNINYYCITRLYKEQETIGRLIQTFQHFTYKTQYQVGIYKIDLYFIDKKIAIECDEVGHKDRDQFYEANREKFIKDMLKCKIVRYNPDELNFNIFNVINQIIRQL